MKTMKTPNKSLEFRTPIHVHVNNILLHITLWLFLQNRSNTKTTRYKFKLIKFDQTFGNSALQTGNTFGLYNVHRKIRLTFDEYCPTWSQILQQFPDLHWSLINQIHCFMGIGILIPNRPLGMGVP